MGELLSGARFGRWTVSDQYVCDRRGERKYFCRCDCGTERYVLERSLKSGGSRSCGCLTRENARRENAYDLTGRSFGDLTALHVSEQAHRNGGVWWTCSCSCGGACDVPATLLVTARKTHCGCQAQKKYRFADISGQHFHRLTALYPTKGRTSQGSVIWHCRCECGNEIEASYNELLYSNIRSCGCQKKEHNAEVKGFLTHFSGTSLDMLKSKKLSASNTTGVRGVYLVKDRWLAKIVFQGKAYYLGSYRDFDTAVKARKEAEELLFEETVAHFERWKARADSDPLWAAENPFEVSVSKGAAGALSVTYCPTLEE